MKKNNNTANNSSIGLGTLLSIIFMVLKLCKVIDWAWIWVFAPLWISLALTLLIIIIVAIAINRR